MSSLHARILSSHGSNLHKCVSSYLILAQISSTFTFRGIQQLTSSVLTAMKYALVKVSHPSDDYMCLKLIERINWPYTTLPSFQKYFSFLTVKTQLLQVQWNTTVHSVWIRILLYVVRRPLWGNKLTWVQISAYLINPNSILSTATASTRVTCLQSGKLGWMLPLQQKRRLTVNSSMHLFFCDQLWQISSIKTSPYSFMEITLPLADSMPSITALTTPCLPRTTSLQIYGFRHKIILHHCHQR